MAEVHAYAPGQTAPAEPILTAQRAPDFSLGAQAIAQGAARLADTATQQIDALQQQANETNAKALDNQAADRLRDLTHGPNGILSKQGVDAVGAQQAFVDDVDNVTQATLGAAKTPVEKSLLASSLAARRADALNIVASHVQQQQQVYAQATDEASIKGFSMDAIQSPDEQHAQVLIGAMNGRIEQNYTRRGLGSDAIVQAKRDATSQVLAGRVNALLGSASTGPQALALLQSYGDKIDPVTQQALKKQAVDLANENDDDKTLMEAVGGSFNDYAQVPASGTPGQAPPVKLTWPTPGYTGIAKGGQFDAYRMASNNNGYAVAAHLHHGTDIEAPEGSPILSAAPGKVIFSGPDGPAGNQVVIDHGGGVVTTYMHMSQIGVRVGQQVDNQSQIGLVGHTGDATGPHLHYQVMVKGSFVDPQAALRVPAPASTPQQPGATPPPPQPGNTSRDGSVAQLPSDPRNWTNAQIATFANTRAGGDPVREVALFQKLSAARSENQAQYDRNAEQGWQAVQPYVTGPQYTDPSQIPMNLRANLKPEQLRSVTELAIVNANNVRSGNVRPDNYQTVGAYQMLAQAAARDPTGPSAAANMTNLQAFATRDPTKDAADLSGPRINDIKAQQDDARAQRGMFAPHKTGTPASFVGELLTGPSSILPPGMSKKDKAAYAVALYDSVQRVARSGPLEQDDVRAIGLKLLQDSGARSMFGSPIEYYKFGTEKKPGAPDTAQNADMISLADRGRLIAAWRAAHPNGPPITEGELVNAWRTQRVAR